MIFPEDFFPVALARLEVPGALPPYPSEANPTPGGATPTPNPTPSVTNATAEGRLELPWHWSGGEVTLYIAIIALVVLLTIGAIVLFNRWRKHHHLGGTKFTGPHLSVAFYFQECLTMQDRVVVRDQQVRRLLQDFPHPQGAQEAVESWRRARREWAAQQPFLESLGRDPAPGILENPQTWSYLKEVHQKGKDLEAAQRRATHAIRQAIMASEN